MTNDKLRELLQATAGADGLVTREGVVEAAAHPDHPLHKDENFLWGRDDEAARRYRLGYAGKLIRQVHFRIRTLERRQARVPYYVRAPQADEHEAGHVRLEDIEQGSGDAVIVARDEVARAAGNLRRAARVAEALQAPGVTAGLIRLHSEARQLLAILDGLRVEAEPAAAGYET